MPFLGRVVSAVPGYPEWMNVVYDGDLSIYVYKLQEEYANGDLKVVPEVNCMFQLQLFIEHLMGLLYHDGHESSTSEVVYGTTSISSTHFRA